MIDQQVLRLFEEVDFTARGQEETDAAIMAVLRASAVPLDCAVITEVINMFVGMQVDAELIGGILRGEFVIVGRDPNGAARWGKA